MQTDRDLGAPRSARHEEAVLRFYSALAEEMRAPLAALAGLTEIIAAQAGPDAAAAQLEIRAILARLRRLADDAHDSAALALGRFELRRRPVDLGEIVAAALPAGTPFTRPAPLIVLGDRDRITRIVRSLLAAGSLAGGRPRAVLEARDAWAELRLITPGFLPVDVIQGLFEPFSRPADVSDGLGLSLSRALAEAHGGKIGADAGEATVLWLRLPLAPES